MFVHGTLQWTGIQDSFFPHAQCSWDTLWMHHNPDQDKVITKVEWINK